MVVRRALPPALLLCTLLSSCKPEDGKGRATPTSPASATPASNASAAPSALLSATPSSPSSAASGAPASSVSPADAGADASTDAGSSKTAGSSSAPASSANAGPPHEDCKLIRGPTQLPFTGPAAVAFLDGDTDTKRARVIFNREGAMGSQAPAFKEPAPGPTSGLLPGAPKKPAPSPKPPLVPEPAPAPERTSWPACSVTDRYVFCMDHDGAIHRRLPSGEGDTIVARGRPGAPIAATSFGDRTILTFLANQKTTEGIITQAFAVLDEGRPVLLSEEGSGATHVAVVERETDVLAMYIDARVALTPLHARTLTIADGKLKTGRDAVVFVGDGAERRMSGAIAWPGKGKGTAHLLIPSTDHDGKFGMASVIIGDTPKDDSPVVWSHYAKEISPAPLAATRGISPVRVARVRPVSSESGSWRVLELGHLDGSGVFKPLCNLVESKSFSDVTIVAGPSGSLWIVYTSADGTWVEQRAR